MTVATPARVHILLARDARTAVVIRRGPTRKVCIVGWNREDDTFHVGQWLYGRIYERRCDLSPDGKHFLYFAMNGQWQSEVLGSWSAVSRAPYLRALGLWAKGDCWNGGGLFLTNRKFWLNDGCGHREIHDHTSMKIEKAHPQANVYGGECPGVYYIRLQRDGWELVSRGPDGQGGRITQFRKRINEHWTLLKHARETIPHTVGRGCYFDEHSLAKKGESGSVRLAQWEWADVDGGRVVWVDAGKLYAGRVGSEGLGKSRMLYDFNPMTYERRTAPY